MAQKAKVFDRGDQSGSPPIIIEMQTDAADSDGDAAAIVNRAMDNLKQATQTAVTLPAQVVGESASQLIESTALLGRKAAKTAIKSYLNRQEKVNESPTTRALEAKAQDVLQGTKNTVKQTRDAVDPRIVAGGLAGLTAGEIVGGAVGGVAGGVVAGPAGMVVGSQVGGFTAGMLGLKLGADAVYDRIEAKRAQKTTVQDVDSAESSRKTSFGRFLQVKTGERLGEIVGLTSGAALGLVIAGPTGGLVGAVVGEALGGHVGEDLNRPPGTNASGAKKSSESAGQWLDRFGKSTAGEAASVLVAGSVGALFGPSGRLVGHRIGLIFGKRVEWHKLGDVENQGAAASQMPLNAPRTTPQDTITAGDPSAVLIEEPPVQLTKRQLEVLALLSQQLTTREIAAQLDITPETVNYHKRNIYKKLKVSSSAEAAYMAVELAPNTNDL